MSPRIANQLYPTVRRDRCSTQDESGQPISYIKNALGSDEHGRHTTERVVGSLPSIHRTPFSLCLSHCDYSTLTIEDGHVDGKLWHLTGHRIGGQLAFRLGSNAVTGEGLNQADGHIVRSRVHSIRALARVPPYPHGIAPRFERNGRLTTSGPFRGVGLKPGAVSRLDARGIGSEQSPLRRVCEAGIGDSGAGPCSLT